jgi:hypothetical protein
MKETRLGSFLLNVKMKGALNRQLSAPDDLVESITHPPSLACTPCP